SATIVSTRNKATGNVDPRPSTFGPSTAPNSLEYALAGPGGSHDATARELPGPARCPCDRRLPDLRRRDRRSVDQDCHHQARQGGDGLAGVVPPRPALRPIPDRRDDPALEGRIDGPPRRGRAAARPAERTVSGIARGAVHVAAHICPESTVLHASLLS